MAHHNSSRLVSTLPPENKNLQGRPTVLPLLCLPGRQHGLNAVGRAVLHLQQAQAQRKTSDVRPLCSCTYSTWISRSTTSCHGSCEHRDVTFLSKPSPGLTEAFRRGATACLIKATLHPFSFYLAIAVKLLQEQLYMLL